MSAVQKYVAVRGVTSQGVGSGATTLAPSNPISELIPELWAKRTHEARHRTTD